MDEPRRESRNLAARLRQIERPEEMALGVESLERRQRAARERLENLLARQLRQPPEAVNSDPKGAGKRTPPIYLQTKSLS